VEIGTGKAGPLIGMDQTLRLRNIMIALRFHRFLMHGNGAIFLAGLFVIITTQWNSTSYSYAQAYARGLQSDDGQFFILNPIIKGWGFLSGVSRIR